MYKTRVAEPYPLQLSMSYVHILNEAPFVEEFCLDASLPVPMAWKGDDFGLVATAQWRLDEAAGEIKWQDCPVIAEPFVLFGNARPKSLSIFHGPLQRSFAATTEPILKHRN